MVQRRIVLVEDNEQEIWLLQDCLRVLTPDLDISILKDGEAALRFIEEQPDQSQSTPCVFVLDVHLPKCDGLEILAAIRRTPAFEHAAILVLSGSPSPETRRQISEYGVPYMEKPISFEGYQNLAVQVRELCKCGQTE